MGKLFAIEGVDGSGKKTQHDLLVRRLESEGYPVFAVSFPRYENESSALVKMYLRGDFGGSPEDVSARVSSIFFAVDRYASFMSEWKGYYEAGGIVLANRYTTSNMVHQASKIEQRQQREEFLAWLWELEFQIFGIPAPTQAFFLNLPVQIALGLIARREGEQDIHERDAAYLAASYACALEVSEKYGWEKIDCAPSGKLLSVEEIHEEIYRRILRYL